MNRRLLFPALAVLGILASCQKSLDTTATKTAVTDQSDALTGPLNVYVAGTVYNASGNSTATYWRNSQPVTLNAGTAGDSYASSMFMYGTDRYVAGVTGKGATYWKNGSPVYVGLTDPNAEITISTGMAVSGSDVFVCGLANTGMLYASASSWKNGVETILNSYGAFFSEAKAIALSNGNVYVAGAELERDGDPIHGRIWKNGKPMSIIQGSSDVFLHTIAVSGSDVYVGGTEAGTDYVTYARYWKNGQPVTLSNGLHNAAVNSLFLSGADIYAAGVNNYGTHNVACYWKNGKLVSLTNGTTDAVANSIVVDSDKNVWVAGSIKNPDGVQVGVYWKNGARVNLSKYGQNASAASIFLSRS